MVGWGIKAKRGFASAKKCTVAPCLELIFMLKYMEPVELIFLKYKDGL